MSPTRLVAVVLIALGALVLVYRGFTYTKHHDVEVGPFDVNYEDHETVPIPVWVGVAAVGVGTAMLVMRRPSRS